MIVEKCKMPLSFKVNQTLLYCLLFLCNMLFSFLLKAEQSNLNSKETALAKAKDWISTSSEKGFIENKGQMSDNNGKPIPFVLFKTEAPNVNIWITESGMTIQTLVLRKEEIAESQMNEIEKQESKQNHQPKKRKFMDWERIDLEFKGAQIKKENVIKEIASETDFNFFNGHCQNGIYGVKEYQKITIKNIYPNIDWVIYRKKEGEVKYDFVVHPGADYKQIELVYKSKNRINLNQEGQLEFTTKYGDILEKKPISFCQNNTISTQFKLNYQKQDIINGDNGFESSYSFNFENFNTSNTADLIIDPDLVWSTFYGGNHLDGPTAIDTDQDGNIFVTGYVVSSNFPTLNPAGGSYFQGTFGSAGDLMLLKFNNAGLLLWATYYGGNDGDRGWFVTTDVNGNIYVTGDSQSTDFPVYDAGSGAYYQDTLAGQLNLVILKFNNSGVLLWGTYYGGNEIDFGYSITVDSNGIIYVTGQTNSDNFPTLDMGSGSYFQGNIGSSVGFNAFLLRFSNTGVLQWATYYGGDSYEIGYGITTDAVGNVFLVGTSESSDFPLLNAGGTSYFQTNGGIGNSNAYVVKFSNTGVRFWATSLGGSSIDEALTVIADDNGDIIITGKTFSNNFPLLNPGAGAYFQGTFGGVIDIFMARFTNNGTQLWTTYFGGTSGENQSWFDNLEIDTCGNIYMTLSSAINDIPLQAQCEGGYFDSLYNGTDVILVVFSNTNKFLWSTFIGGNGLDIQGALAVDKHKNVFIAGEWCGNSVNNSTYPLVNAGGGAYFDGTFNGGGDDGFVLKFAPTIPIINTNVLQPTCTNLCAGEALVNITGSCNYNYLWNNGQTTQTATGLCPGNYTVQITNPVCGGLDTLIQVTIVAPPSSITPSFAAFGNFCAGDTIQVLPTTSINNVTGIWSPALNNTVSTTYTFTPNAGQCALDTQLTIQINPLPVVNAFSNNVFCENQALQLSVNTTIGASYSWQGPNAFTSIQQNNSIPNITNVNSGLYVVNVNLNTCIGSDTININVIAPTFFNQSIQLCNGQSYQLPDGSFTDSAGVYNHLFIGVNGCDSIINTTVILINALQSNISAQICTGQSYILPDSNVVFNTGLYVVTIPSIAGCDSIIQINLIAGNTSVDSLSIQLCQGQNYTLPDGNIANTNGVFPVILQNQFGCDSIIVTSINVLQNIIPSLQINAIPNNIICAGSPVLFTSTVSNVGFNPIYQWYINGVALPGAANDSLTISSLQNSDTISLTIISSLNCNDSNIVYSNNIVISVISAPNYLLHISCSDSILCALQKATFTASVSNVSNNFIYQWYINNILVQESNDSTFNYSNFNDGDSVICSIVTPTVCNGISQIYSNAIVIKVNPNPTIDLVIYEYWQNYGDTLQLIGYTNVSNAVYYWSSNANLSCSNCTNPSIVAIDTAQYMLTVTDASTGCFTIDSLMVYVIEDFDIFLPNGFSPNGDDNNDIFLLRGRGIKDFILNVYDRWGELIFTSNSLNYGWDGTFNSKPLMSGTYVYTLSYTNFKNINKFTKGNLTLIR
jgi:gliding motility-associated-like protein